MRSLVSSAYGNFRFIGSGMKIVCNFESLPYGVDTVASEVGLQFLTTGHLSLKSGFPNKDGINSSRNKSNCALAPTDRPASLFNGTTASAATCQLTATYENPGFIVATVFCPRAESNENSTRGTSWFSGSSWGSLPGVKRLVR